MSTPWITPQIIFLILHIFGSVLGAGAAFTGDTIFLTSVRNKMLATNELRIMKTTSRLIWIGLLILFISGVGLVWQRPEIFLHSGKFWAKMTVIGVIIGNGLLFHFIHFTVFRKGADKKFSESHPIIKRRTWLVMSGAVSVLSWSFVIILGVLGRTPYTYLQFITVYLLFLFTACVLGFLMKSKIISA